MIGEHGDSEVPAWSLANIGGMKLADFCQAQAIEPDSEAMEEIFGQRRGAAYQMTSARVHLLRPFLPGSCGSVQRFSATRTLLSLSSLMQDFYSVSDVCLNLPTVVNRTGIAKL